MRKPICVEIKSEVDRYLRVKSAKMAISKSKLIRQILDEWIKKEDKKAKVSISSSK